MYIVLFSYGYEGYGLAQFYSNDVGACKAYVEKHNATWGWRQQQVNWTQKGDLLFLEDPYTHRSRYEGWVIQKIVC